MRRLVLALCLVTLVATDLGLFKPVGEGFAVLELAPDVTLDDVRAATGSSIAAAPAAATK